MNQHRMTDWFDAYRDGHITKQDLFISVLAAEESAASCGAFVAVLPADLGREFLDFVRGYEIDAPLVRVGAGDSSPPHAATIEGLRAALRERFGTRDT